MKYPKTHEGPDPIGLSRRPLLLLYCMYIFITIYNRYIFITELRIYYRSQYFIEGAEEVGSDDMIANCNAGIISLRGLVAI